MFQNKGKEGVMNYLSPMKAPIKKYDKEDSKIEKIQILLFH
jgi:hypothetical protein